MIEKVTIRIFRWFDLVIDETQIGRFLKLFYNLSIFFDRPKFWDMSAISILLTRDRQDSGTHK